MLYYRNSDGSISPVAPRINDAAPSDKTTYSGSKVKSLIETTDISDSVSGVNPSITDSADGYVQGLTVYGRSRVSKNLAPLPAKGAYDNENGAYRADLEDNYVYSLCSVQPNTQYTAFVENIGSLAMYIVYFNGTPGTSTYISSAAYAYSTATITTPPGCTCLVIETGRGSTPETVGHVQFELGSTATPYEPYNEIISIGDSGSLTITTANSDSSENSTAALTTGLPLCGIPVTTGETYTDGDGVKWLADELSVEGVIKRTYKMTLNGSETWAEVSGGTTGQDGSKIYGFTMTQHLPYPVSVSEIALAVSSLNVVSANDNFAARSTNCISINSNDFAIRISSISTVEALQTYLASNPVTMVYELAESTTTPLTTAEKSALLNLKTFDSTTNVTVTDAPTVDISYIKNTDNGKAIAQLSENLMSMLSGGTPTFSFARAVYDAGDTVTATDGITTLTSDTSGDYVFAIPNSGTWTFSDGTTTITKSLTTYGEITKCNLISLLPASVEKNILAEIRAGHFSLGEDVGEGFKATNSNTFSLAEDGSLVTSATGHVYYDLVSANQPATIYFVGKCPDDMTITRVMARHHANSSGESPGFYTESNKILNATYYGSNSPTSISKTSLFVCAMSLSVTGSYKWAYYYANDTFTTNKNVVNAGRYCYFAGTSVTANTPTGTTEYGDAVTISYIGIVNGAEDATTIATNIAAIMAAFEIS